MASIVCIQVLPPMLWMPNFFPRNCSADLMFGPAMSVWVSLLETEERIRR